MPVISNDVLDVSINTKGAELTSIRSKETKLEYMWSGDPAFWGKWSPVLFPVVGTLKNDTYYFKGNPYKLGRHGFAREMEFDISRQTADSITFSLISSQATQQNYPFHFRFDIVYRLKENTISVTYIVTNTGNDELFFSVGGHPAFKVPLIDGTTYTDYYLEFSKKENEERWPISKEGLIEMTPEPFLKNTSQIPLTKELFQQDALVFKNLQSDTVALKSSKTKNGLSFKYPGFPYLGIWAAKNADFVCIEPWCGIADSVVSDQQLIHKEGINNLKPAAVFEREWSVTLF